MRRLMVTTYRLYAFTAISYWLFATGIALVLGSLLMPVPAAKGVIFLALIFIAGFPLLAVIIMFNTIESNRHLSLIPYGSQFLLGATCFLTVLLSFLCSWGITLMDKPNQPGLTGIFLTVVCLSSLATVLVKVVFSSRFIPFVLWIIVMVFHEFFQGAWQQLPGIDTSRMHAILVLISLLSWSWLALSLGRATDSERKSFGVLLQKKKHSWIEKLVSKSTEPIQLSKVLTLMQGIPLTKNSRFWMTVGMFLGVLVAGVFFLWLVKKSSIRGEELLAIQCIAVVILPFTSGEWVARLRLLWLKMPGDRRQFWQHWNNHLHQEILISMVILSAYSFGTSLFFDVSHISLALYTVIIFLLLPSMCYSAAWFRLKGEFKNSLAVWSGIIYLFMVVFLIIASYINATYPSIIGLALLSSSICLLTYLQVKKDFLTLDWLKVRPTQQAKLGPGRR